MKNLIDIDTLFATRSALDISVTERAQFRTCRRAWRLRVIENLVPRAPDWALSFGTGMHLALDAYYTEMCHAAKVGVPSDVAKVIFANWYADERERLMDLKDLPVEVLDEHDEYLDLGLNMLNGYFEYDAKSNNPLGRVVAVEGELYDTDVFVGKPPYANATPMRHPSGRILVPIVNPKTKKRLPGSPWLSGRIDLMTIRDTGAKGLWIVDHKTAARAPSDRGLDFDDQVTGYCYIVWRLTGLLPRGVIYNVLVKQVPKPPRILQSGALSTAKDQLTTPDMYREAMREHGHITATGKITSEKHGECLNALLARGMDPFFKRMEMTRNLDQMHAFEEHLAFEYRDMRAALKDVQLQYPNPGVHRCGTCPVNRICQAMDDGSDYETIIDLEYEQGPDRKAVEHG